MVDEVQVEMYSGDYKSNYCHGIPFIPKPRFKPCPRIRIGANTRTNKYIHRSIHVSSNALNNYDYRSVFRPHFAHLLGSFISMAFAFALAFSMSWFVIFGVGGSSSILDMPREFLFGAFTLFGNTLRRGVKAVAMRLADFRILERTSQALFFAR